MYTCAQSSCQHAIGAMATDDGSCCLIEVMGRSAGWIAAGTILAKRTANAAPHIILVPEIPFVEGPFLAKVKEIVAANYGKADVLCDVLVYAQISVLHHLYRVSTSRSGAPSFGLRHVPRIPS